MKIILMRHGEPDLLETALTQSLPASAMKQWVEDYNASQVKPLPESILKQLLSDVLDASSDSAPPFVVCSELRRSVHSAELLKEGGVIDSVSTVELDFHEAELPCFKVPWLRMKPMIWCVLFRLMWFAGLSKGSGELVESYRRFRTRADNAIKQLEYHARQHESVLFVGHGVLNRVLLNGLRSRGWSLVEHVRKAGKRDFKYWGSVELVRK